MNRMLLPAALIAAFLRSPSSRHDDDAAPGRASSKQGNFRLRAARPCSRSSSARWRCCTRSFFPEHIKAFQAVIKADPQCADGCSLATSAYQPAPLRRCRPWP